jgi:MSHA pilin protein MshA
MRNQKGFTLIEIIAVLVILGVLAAVAVPKYVNMAGQAKKSAGQGEVAEMKSTLNLAYAKLYMSNGSAPTAPATIIATSGIGTNTTVGTAPDIWKITFTANGTVGVNISIVDRNGDTSYAATGAWYIPI